MRTLLLLLLLSWPCLAQPTVVISIDGMNPDFYQSERYQTPALKQLARQGLSVAKVWSVYPSLTYPNHTALVTGCYPATHGVIANVIDGRHEWYWRADTIQVKTLWQAATDQGMRVALLGWPVTVGARVDFLIPEVFYVAGTGPETTEERIRKHSTPGLLQRLNVRIPDNFPSWDEQMTRSCEQLLQEKAVDLLQVHFIQVDQTQHLYGPDDERVDQAIARVDELIGRVAEAAGPEANIAVVGDHGFRPYREIIYPQAMLKAAGLTHLGHAHAAGGSAAIYSQAPEVRAFFGQESQGRYEVVERSQLDELKAFPGAGFALEAGDGVMFSYADKGPSVTDRVKGQHGHLPEKVPTGLLLRAPGVTPGLHLLEARVVDVAPTLAGLMGLELPQAEGRNLLEQP